MAVNPHRGWKRDIKHPKVRLYIGWNGRQSSSGMETFDGMPASVSIAACWNGRQSSSGMETE